MRAFRLGLVIVVLLVAAYARLATPPHGSSRMGAPAVSSANSGTVSIPSKALDVLAYVRRTGEAPDGYVGGTTFQNREGRLPEGGDYREFDVDPHHGGRNAERLIVDGATKRAWYTADHYETFTPIP